MEVNFKDLLNQQLNDFYEKIVNLKNFQSIIKENTASLLKGLSEKRERIEQINEDPTVDDIIKKFNGRQLRNFSFFSPYSGVREFIGYRNIDIQEQADLHFIHKNKQYQWLLVEAYEAFEDFVESIYGCAGYIDPAFWSASDFGDISLKDIALQDFEWFHNQAIKKKHSPRSILQKFRLKLPNFANVEQNNKTFNNYRLTITMIENFRHVIVHRNGTFGDKSQFIKKVIQESDLSRKDTVIAEKLLAQYTSQLNGKDVIYLLEKQTLTSFMYYDTLGQLLDIVLGYAFIIKCELDEYLSSNGCENT